MTIRMAAFAVFCFCTWAVFYKRFLDGIIAKHLLTFSAIASALAVLDHQNVTALLFGFLFLALGLCYTWFRYRRFIDRRTRPRGAACLTPKN